MKVKALKNYKDMKLNRLVEAGEVIEVSDERGTELVKHSMHIVEQVLEKPRYDLTPPLKTPETTHLEGDVQPITKPSKKKKK